MTTVFLLVENNWKLYTKSNEYVYVMSRKR